jgi:prenyltransferase beta subunit
MRLIVSIVVAVVPGVVLAQQPLDTAAQKRQTLSWVLSLQDSNGGFYATVSAMRVPPKQDPSLRATSAAVRTIKHLGGEVPRIVKTRDFVLSCYDPKTGGFAEPGGQPDVAMTSTGVMAAVELGIPHDKFAKAMDYLQQHAKTFEEVRIGAAAVEAWGVKDCPFKLDSWHDVANKYMKAFPTELSIKKMQDGEARDWGSVIAFDLRLGLAKTTDFQASLLIIGQREDGGWSRTGEKASDLESTYRVMRALMLLKAKPKNPQALRLFVQSHRNKDGGYGARLAEKSSASGTYYAVMVTRWLDEMEKELPEKK